MSERDRLRILVSNWVRHPITDGLLEDLELFAYQCQGKESVRCEQLARIAGQSELADQIKDTFPEMLT